MTVVIPSISLEYVKVPVTVKKNGQYVDPTSAGVSMAFMTSKSTEPTGPDWHNATWEVGLGYKYYIGCLVGPTGVVLANGIYWVWIKIVDSPETPIRQVGTIKIT